jgi:hypothetical protein
MQILKVETKPYFTFIKYQSSTSNKKGSAVHDSSKLQVHQTHTTASSFTSKGQMDEDGEILLKSQRFICSCYFFFFVSLWQKI